MSLSKSHIISTINSDVELVGGRLHKYFSFWTHVTQNKFVLQCIAGMKIPLISDVPLQVKIPTPYKMNRQESDFIEKELQSMLDNGTIVELDKIDTSGWVSNIFLRPKKQKGLYRIILDL